ncbi:zinc-dependent peptidase [Winogradskyella flava]|uniref:Zinc-dependent peptidase n=1 Tax=Winogradskyella flava TaxID=1884876 RepID=A0A842IQI4_9FLAO|nr:zinc-dependent peptidase [Winogradskyella flava]MBC2844469.1 zinc-dependent peptidase [Winogradskyella flava]
MIYLQAAQSSETNPTLITILLIVLALVILRRFIIYVEQIYALKYKKPFFRNIILVKNQLTDNQLKLLEKEFTFYKNLSDKEQAVFRHRVATFIKNKKFIGRESLVPNDEIRTLISATAVMLTFGFRKYLIDLIEKIIIYPEAYYSTLNDTYHKGEINPQMNAIVFSWKDFQEGYHIGDDNLNLGIHEFGHAIHLNAFSKDDISSLIFQTGFKNLTDYLQQNQAVRQDLIDSKYFRAYAYTNHYEFFAVLLENFIETPNQFRTHFPELYSFVKQMLNFKFARF